MITAGAGGAITGRGAHLAIVDDPVKSPEEAQSEAVSRRIWDWYRAVLRIRLEPGGAIVVVMTRWHEADLAGRLLTEGGKDWEILNLPALHQVGVEVGHHPDAVDPQGCPVPLHPQIQRGAGTPVHQLEDRRVVLARQAGSGVFSLTSPTTTGSPTAAIAGNSPRQS